MIAVIKLLNHRYGAGPGVVLEVTDAPVAAILARHTDRDGARSERLRLWRAYEGCRAGDVVTL